MPAVVIVPGATGAGRTPTTRRLAESGIFVERFHAEGRASGWPWDIRYSGATNPNGSRDQDRLAAIGHAIARRREVDPKRIGVYSISFELAASTGATRNPDLPIQFILDGKGPTNGFAASLQARTLAPSDGDCWPQRA